jgi:hypothetical protein
VHGQKASALHLIANLDWQGAHNGEEGKGEEGKGEEGEAEDKALSRRREVSDAMSKTSSTDPASSHP